MPKPLRSIPKLGYAFWRATAAGVVKRIKLITKAGRGVDGAFPGYSNKYAERKGAGKFRRQSSQSTRPDLTLTGDMMRDLQTHEADDWGVTIGWTSHGARMRYNAEMGRAVSTDDKPLARSVELWLRREIAKQLNDNVKAARRYERIPLRVLP